MRFRPIVLVVILVGILAMGLPAEAQQAGKVYRIGFLYNSPPTAPGVSGNLDAFRQGLREHGWVEGQNIVIEYRSAQGRVERLPDLAAELVSLKVDVIVVSTTPGIRAAKQATSTIPIVMVYVFDPVGSGFVASLARPGGNVTGVTGLADPLIVGKHLELLKETVPKLSRVAVLLTPDPISAVYLRGVQAGAQVSTVKLQLLTVQRPNEFEDAFAAMIKERAGGLLVSQHTLFFAHSRQIVDLAAKHRLPAVYPTKEAVEAGGLIAYAVNAPQMYWRVAIHVDKILKGAKPADLPVEQPTKFELVINLKTAKALALLDPAIAAAAGGPSHRMNRRATPTGFDRRSRAPRIFQL